MELITAKIAKELAKYPIHSQKDKGSEAKIIVKYFNPCGMGTWYVTEAEKLPNGDYNFFGIVHLYEKESGYFLLSQLKALKFSLLD